MFITTFLLIVWIIDLPLWIVLVLAVNHFDNAGHEHGQFIDRVSALLPEGYDHIIEVENLNELPLGYVNLFEDRDPTGYVLINRVEYLISDQNLCDLLAVDFLGLVHLVNHMQEVVLLVLCQH